MEKSNVVIVMLVLWVLCVSCTKAGKLSPLEIEIEAKLKLLNKPAVKTIQSEDGDIIDCVDIYKQPAFDHPALKNHTIQTVPNFLLEIQNSRTEEASESQSVVFQTWQKSGSCPKGTIPIRRILKEDLLRAAFLDQFGRKPSAVFNNSTKTFHTNDSKLYASQRRSASYLSSKAPTYGVLADINIWNPKVDLPYDFTTAQLRLKTDNGPNYESVEAGWMVNPMLYGDTNTRLFAYWTSTDSSKSTGCFDLACSGFVQTGSTVALGSTVKPVSTTHGPQYVISVGIFRNWWLALWNDKTVPIGYWPWVLFDNLREFATSVEMGGEVVSSNVKRRRPHTATGMGSGDLINDLKGSACFMRHLKVKYAGRALRYPYEPTAVADEPTCYNCYNQMDGFGGLPVFYFGGPYCP
ncbi:uncharacterized protein LOC109796315 [Cajanus cajan]|uniref:uncharacterized protein LOC109796315 n=1 Tax=Cajanus cajan TaxID=3821 RepID=UPI00098D758F|nr:uncharacterized protein LOC109796315 [Cajanus cajan]